jgi:hypothetical protein
MVVVESKRDQRVLDGVVERVGHEGVAQACSKLAGGRNADPSNVAKVLGVMPPHALAVASRAHATAHLHEIARLLGVRPCT